MTVVPTVAAAAAASPSVLFGAPVIHTTIPHKRARTSVGEHGQTPPQSPMTYLSEELPVGTSVDDTHTMTFTLVDEPNY